MRWPSDRAERDCAESPTVRQTVVQPSLCVQLGVRPQVHVLRHAGVHGTRDPHGRGARQGGRLVVRATLSTQSAHCAHRQARWCKHVWTRAHAHPHPHPRTLVSWLAHANALLVMDGATTGADQVAWDSYLRDACRPTAVLFAQQEGNVQQTAAQSHRRCLLAKAEAVALRPVLKSVGRRVCVTGTVIGRSSSTCGCAV